MTPREALADVWARVGGEAAALGQVTITGDDPVLPGVFRVGTAAAATIAAAGLAATELWRLRTGRRQPVTLDVRAAAAAFRSERYLRVDDRPAHEGWHPVSGFFQCGDGRWIQLHCNFPHHRQRALDVIGCAESREAVVKALGDWKAATLEDAIVARGGCAGMVRAPEEWQAHPQGRALAALPLLEITRLGEAPPRPAGAGERPLSGVRVVDLTRVIAGPVCGRTLAEHGADVLLVTGPHLPNMEPLVIDNGRGKRAAHLDLRQAADVERLRALVSQADVFVQSYRPDTLAGRGLTLEALAALRPGLVYVTLNAYGHTGPWQARRGFDSLVQSVSGIAWESGRAFGLAGPRHLPCQALDHATGYLAAVGAMRALARRAVEGGSWMVRLSLAQTGRWIDGLGRVDGTRLADPTVDDVADLMATCESPFGRLRHVAPAPGLAQTPGRWERPPTRLGSDPPVWV
ncbi:MAG TPA: CoA transferase [Methylomirabilota bacterium]|nr:CoA transferase [Methylomirabilota bacterium]